MVAARDYLDRVKAERERIDAETLAKSNENKLRLAETLMSGVRVPKSATTEQGGTPGSENVISLSEKIKELEEMRKRLTAGGFPTGDAQEKAA
jgi:hypothetical protein